MQVKKFIKYAIIGFLFGITMYKSEAISWFRIYEMFKFQSFHMYGIIGTAVVSGIVVVLLFKKGALKGYKWKKIEFIAKARGWKRYLFGGLIFGLGWGMGGACPGPIFVLIGSGYSIFIAFMLAAMLGTFVYGVLRKKLPH
ncbi:MAG: YeeE/YedE family protein [Putridiphycobacter sp.]